MTTFCKACGRELGKGSEYCSQDCYDAKENRRTVPTVHLNGTAAVTLLDAYGDANEALRAAVQAVSETEPNGRDYPQGGYDRARNEHVARLKALQALVADFQALSMAVYDQQQAREAARHRVTSPVTDVKEK